MAIKQILKTRQTTHGDYAQKCDTIQQLKHTIKATDGYWNLTSAQMESLDLICTKIGRILYGNPNTIDHWEDIAGYAQLISENLSSHVHTKAQS